MPSKNTTRKNYVKIVFQKYEQQFTHYRKRHFRKL